MSNETHRTSAPPTGGPQHHHHHHAALRMALGSILAPKRPNSAPVSRTISGTASPAHFPPGIAYPPHPPASSETVKHASDSHVPQRPSRLAGTRSYSADHLGVPGVNEDHSHSEPGSLNASGSSSPVNGAMTPHHGHPSGAHTPPSVLPRVMEENTIKQAYAPKPVEMSSSRNDSWDALIHGLAGR
ncbi:hypothetical protein DL96DRAFT_1713314 [Flagelloscypha sp. PMI_526]|nr:hypothetical protein DL96DRAFT_1713314 [Flagelloscypha sp. PMI_526]